MAGNRLVRLPAICVLGLALVLAGCGGDDDEPSEEPAEEAALEVPEGAIAFVDEVDDGEITQEDFDAAMSFNAGIQGKDEVPPETDPQYDAFVITSVSDLLAVAWTRGEAEERGISLTEAEIDAELESTIKSSFSGQKDYEQFLEDSAVTEEEARERIELQALTTAVQDDVIAEAGDPKDPQAAVTEFQEEFLAKWRERTVCSEDLLADDDGTIEAPLAERCSNFELSEGTEPPAE